MAQFKQWFTQDLTESIVVRHCESVMFTGDDKGAVVGVRLYDNGAAYSGGGTVTGAVKRIDGGLVPLTGTLSGNAASVVIPAAALAFPGPIGMRIVLTQGGQTTTILKAIYSVDDNTGTPVDPGDVVPDYEELLSEIDAMRTATAAANAAAAAADTARAGIPAEIQSNFNHITSGKINLYDRNDPDILIGQYWDRDGTLKTNAAISQTGFIPVTAGNDYTANYREGFVLWYNSAKTNIGNTESQDFIGNGYATAPTGAVYARFIMATAHVNDMWVNEGRTVEQMTISPDAGAVVYNAEQALTDAEKETACGNIGVTPYAESKNLFTPDAPDYLVGQYYNTSGTLVTASGTNQTGLIPVTAGNDYTANFIEGFVLWYNSTPALIGYTGTGDFRAEGYATAPANAAFTRFILATGHEPIFQVNAGQTALPFMPYGAKYPKTEYYGKNGVAFGTSLTYRAQTTGGYLQALPGLSGTAFDNQGIGGATILYNATLGSEKDILAKIKSYTGYAGKDVCLLEGFCNDWWSNPAALGTWKDTGETTVCGCVRSAINYILTQNPDITLILVLDHYGQGINASLALNSENKTQLEYYEEIAKVAESMGIPIVYQNKLSGIDEKTPQFLIDNIHPNSLGALQSAKTIWSVMQNVPLKAQ